MKGCKGNPDCTPGNYSCIDLDDESNSGKTVGMLTECSEDKIETTTPCQNEGEKVSCNKDGVSCGVCLNATSDEDYTCIDKNGFGYKKICKHGQWDETAPCDNNASCNPDNDKCGECQNGDNKCDNDPETGVGFISSCMDGKWVKEPCPYNVSCDASKLSCGKCRDGQKRCQEKEYVGVFEICKNGSWADTSDTTEYCFNKDNGHLQSCHFLGNECGSCLNNTITGCTSDGQLSICLGGMETETECPGNNICNVNNENAHCSCNPSTSQKHCVNTNDGQLGMIWTCEETGWTVTGCSDNSSCNQEMSDCGICRNGATRCNTDTNKTSTCENGEWGDDSDCENKYSCKMDGTCGDCTNGGTKCEGDNVQTCKNGEWLTSETCAYGCNPVNNKCISCVNEDAKCEKDILLTCENNEWIKKTECHLGCNSIQNQCNTSTDNRECEKFEDKRCHIKTEGNYSKAITQLCSDSGIWKDTQYDKLICKPDKQCLNDNDRIGSIGSFIDGEWRIDSKCNEKSCNSNGKECGVCKNGETRCKDKKVQICENGDWSRLTDCNCTSDENITCNKSCINTPQGIGVITKTLEFCSRSDAIVSCNNMNSDCGTCLNNTITSCWISNEKNTKLLNLKVCENGIESDDAYKLNSNSFLTNSNNVNSVIKNNTIFGHCLKDTETNTFSFSLLNVGDEFNTGKKCIQYINDKESGHNIGIGLLFNVQHFKTNKFASSDSEYKNTSSDSNSGTDNVIFSLEKICQNGCDTKQDDCNAEQARP